MTVGVNGSRPLPGEVETAAYFCCLEAMQNVAKHAPEASGVAVSLSRTETLCFEVRDDGPGFDLNGSRPAHGLLNMRDRMDAVGGELEVASAAGSGTRIGGRCPA